MRAVLVVVALFAVVVSVSAASCDAPDDAAGCDPACAAAAPACDDGCPAVASEVCVDGACVAVGEGDFDVAITVALGRDIADRVVAASVALVDARVVAACADVGAVKDADGVVAGNRIELDGGPFHPDLHVGRVGAGDYLVVVDALDADAAVVASSCAALDVAADAAVTLDVPAL